MDDIRNSLQFIRDHGLSPDVETIIGCTTSDEVAIDGRKVLLFCSNDYLGLASSPKLKAAAHEAIERYGIGSGGSRLVSGSSDIQWQLEREIAEFKGREAAITFSTGYMANTGVIPAITNLINLKESGDHYELSPFLGKRTTIFVDELCHASVFDGARLSRARAVSFNHNDMGDLESKLHRYEDHRKLIVTDGVFSMDGDLAPLPYVVGLAKKYQSLIMVDDAHASGILGKNGRGTIEHWGLNEGDVDIMMGTFTKSFGGVGGFIAGDHELVDFLRASARPYIFSAPIPPSIVAAIIAAIREAKTNSEPRQRLWENAAYLRDNLRRMGFDTAESETQIVPVVVGDEKKCMELSKQLLASGVFVPPVRWPAVPWGEARLRVIVRATHAREQIDYFLECMEIIGRRLGIIHEPYRGAQKES